MYASSISSASGGDDEDDAIFQFHPVASAAGSAVSPADDALWEFCGAKRSTRTGRVLVKYFLCRAKSSGQMCEAKRRITFRYNEAGVLLHQRELFYGKHNHVAVASLSPLSSPVECSGVALGTKRSRASGSIHNASKRRRTTCHCSVPTSSSYGWDSSFSESDCTDVEYVGAHGSPVTQSDVEGTREERNSSYRRETASPLSLPLPRSFGGASKKTRPPLSRVAADQKKRTKETDIERKAAANVYRLYSSYAIPSFSGGAPRRKATASAAETTATTTPYNVDGFESYGGGSKIVNGGKIRRYYYRCMTRGCSAKQQVDKERFTDKLLNVVAKGMHIPQCVLRKT